VAPPDGHRALAARQPPMLLKLLDRRIVFFGGKGGVGKTTCSSAFALAASRRGQRLLLVSTDPSHSLSDIFERPIGPAPVDLGPGLRAIEIDANEESRRYVERVKQDIERMFAPTVVRQAYRQIDLAAASPGLAEVALLDRMIDLLDSHTASSELIVFDTAPIGHTLQLLRMPEAVEVWLAALVRHRRALLEIERGRDSQEDASDDDPVLAALERRHARLKVLRDVVLDRGRTSFVLVTNPERLAIEETSRAARLLDETGVNVAGLIVNRVLPEGLEGEFYRSRKTQEAGYLKEIAERFQQLPRLAVPQLPRDVYGLATLEEIAANLL
jgi:arsenite-transporting ATPase